MNRALIASVLVATLLATIPGVSSDAYGQPRPPRQNPQQQQQPPSIDAASREVFERFDEFVKTLDSFRVRFQATMDEPAEHSLGSEVVLNYLVGAQRPNKFAMIPTRIDRGMTVVCDGSNLYTYAPGPNQYLVEPAPPTLAQVLDAARLSLADMNMSLVVFIQMLLQDEPLTYLVSTAQKAEYVDDRDSDDKRDKALVDGYLDYEDTTYSKVEWESKGHKAELWFRNGDRPLLDRASPDAKSFGLQGEDRGGGSNTDMRITFEDWTLNKRLGGRLFRFNPPPGAKKVSTFNELTVSEDYRPLLDESVPMFTLDMVGGGRLDLGKHRNKDVVILDFWASWCGPCRIGLPILNKVAQDYKDKNVVFYAINLKESREVAQQFLNQSGMNMTVALDVDGKVAGQFKVKGIPHTVIINKHGTIKAVHSGLPMDLNERIRKELDEVLATQDDEKPVQRGPGRRRP